MTDLHSVSQRIAMKRIVKDPEERKRELIDAAERLFTRNGFEQTLVSDIVREVDVSQGAFYYYFESKEDVLVAIVKKNIASMEQDITDIARKDDLDPALKLNLIFNRFVSVAVSGKEIFSYIHQHKSTTLHQKLRKDKPFSRISPIVAGVISSGNQKGRFMVDYPHETAILLLALLVSSLHMFCLLEGKGKLMDTEQGDELDMDKMRIALEDLLSRMLGASDYKFSLQI